MLEPDKIDESQGKKKIIKIMKNALPRSVEKTKQNKTVLSGFNSSIIYEALIVPSFLPDTE